eukprot:gnl/TRDRNA2_/TRDRNA2_200702_c0_seq1.p1 gnl/TRDRNA2_/TRDRNA2_200702_c0~~gnl/TRDRNA2_/TRDRNA2_200702_c0_seq1.p1  ORF type:complete len:274 (-),score=45.21 gnl/TRDRNA2_/TRDRNA2_200702_c0_seq1:27-848(-)
MGGYFADKPSLNGHANGDSAEQSNGCHIDACGNNSPSIVDPVTAEAAATQGDASMLDPDFRRALLQDERTALPCKQQPQSGSRSPSPPVASSDGRPPPVPGVPRLDMSKANGSKSEQAYGARDRQSRSPSSAGEGDDSWSPRRKAEFDWPPPSSGSELRPLDAVAQGLRRHQLQRHESASTTASSTPTTPTTGSSGNGIVHDWLRYWSCMFSASHCCASDTRPGRQQDGNGTPRHGPQGANLPTHESSVLHRALRPDADPAVPYALRTGAKAA